MIAFKGRVLPFDLDASQTHAVMARAKAEGKVISEAYGCIAAIASARTLKIATRDIGPFQAADLSIINPWDV